MMYLSKIEFVPSEWQRMVKVLNKGLYYEHQMIWDLLPKDEHAQRDFLFRREDSEVLPFYYLLSSREPVVNVDYLQCSTRLYAPQLQAGDRLQFSLRANAVKSRQSADGKKRRIRRDIVEARTDVYKAQFPDPQDRPTAAFIRHEAGSEWLQAQGHKGGFEVISLSVENPQFYETVKPGDVNKRQFTSLDFRGELLVTDAAVFIDEVLFKGIGRSKAFGCGLFLVRRA